MPPEVLHRLIQHCGLADCAAGRTVMPRTNPPMPVESGAAWCIPAAGRRPAPGAIGSTCRYSADMSKHAYLGTDPTLKAEYQDYAQRL